MSDTNNRSNLDIDEQVSEHESRGQRQESPSRSGPSRRQTLKAIAGASLLPGVALSSDTVAAQSGTIIDSEDSSAVSVTGTWPTSTYNSNYVGSNYRHDDDSGKGSKSVTYTPDLPTDDPYNVFLYWNSSSNRATNIPVDIDYNGGSTTVTVDQTTSGGQWNHVGTHQFTSGAGESISIRNDGTNEFVIADAVNFARATLDSEDSSGVSITGSWTSSTYTSGYRGDNYKHDGDGGKGDRSVQYGPAIPADGDYTVSIWYTDGKNRATNTKIDVAGKHSTYTETVNQTQNGSQWVTLGTYTLDSTATVTIRNGNTDGYVVADAVKFVPA